MPWIRLDDDYIYHPKFAVLSDRAFRLWHEGLALCRKTLNDGLIATDKLKMFRAVSKAALKELTTPLHQECAPLWEPIEGFGFKVHDYLIWNKSREEELKRKEESRVRSANVRAKNIRTNVRTSARRPEEEEGSSLLPERESEGKPALGPSGSALVSERAGWLVRRYEELFHELRGARLFRARPALDYDAALGLCQTWPDDRRLEKLAILVLTTDDDWIARTDRNFKIFAAKASWADDRLATWERDHPEAIRT